MNLKRGTLFLVVGPSGAGKDSLIDGAKAALARNNDKHYVFPRRYITRPTEAGGENHVAVTPEIFEALLKNDDMVLSWQAHNLRYGVPMSVESHLKAGRSVVLNVSRTVVDQARIALAPIKVLYITVSDEVLTKRLQDRGRETVADIQRRVARAGEYEISGDDVCVIDNGGKLKASITAFLKAIG